MLLKTKPKYAIICFRKCIMVKNMSEEIRNENATIEDIKLDSPLVVHKKGDASYEESASAPEMNDTHIEDDSPTLRRHRFKKEKRGYGGLIAVLIIIVIIAGAFSALYFTDNIKFVSKTTTKKEVSTTEAVTTLEELYQGTIVVKDTYLFVNGVEVDGIAGLQEALEYEDKSPTAFTIIDENANSDFLNFEVLQILEKMGFYSSDTVITHKASTGLIAKAETTTLPPETTSTTKKAESTTKKQN